MVTIPIADPEIGQDEKERVLDVLDSGHLAAGDVVETFEEQFRTFAGTEYGVATTNGTTALHAALEAIGLEPGSRVITTAFSFVASANAIRFAGGIPIFADIDPDTYTIDPEHVEELIRARNGRIDAIVPVHLYGLPADMDYLRDIADEYEIPLVADAAQAHGATYRGDPIGSVADVTCFSFYPTKNMTTGEGGLLTTDLADVARAARRFIDHGRSSDGYDHVELGHNYRMTDIAAAIGLGQLDRLPRFLSARRENATRLTEGLADAPVTTPTVPEDRTHAFNQYTVRGRDRGRRQDVLEAHGIETAVYYPEPIPDLEAYNMSGSAPPISRRLADQVLSLPVHPNVTEDDLDRIIDAVTRVAVDA